MTFSVRYAIVTGKMSKTNHSDPVNPLVNREQMGRLIRAARTIAGFDRVEDAAQAVVDRTGFQMSARTLYSLERGEQSISLEHMFAIVMTFDVPGGILFFERGLRADLQEMLRQSRRPGGI